MLDADVRVESALLVASIGTERARERLLPRVGADVIHKVRLPLSGVVTKHALMSLQRNTGVRLGTEAHFGQG